MLLLMYMFLDDFFRLMHFIEYLIDYQVFKVNNNTFNSWIVLTDTSVLANFFR